MIFLHVLYGTIIVRVVCSYIFLLIVIYVTWIDATSAMVSLQHRADNPKGEFTSWHLTPLCPHPKAIAIRSLLSVKQICNSISRLPTIKLQENLLWILCHHFPLTIIVAYIHIAYIFSHELSYSYYFYCLYLYMFLLHLCCLYLYCFCCCRRLSQ